MKIEVLGTPYVVRYVKFGQDEYMEKMNFCGYCDNNTKQIVILDLGTVPEWMGEPEDVIAERHKTTVRHELIHAFLNESGLQCSSNSTEAWAKNEEMVDWFAVQMPKLLKAYKKAGCI